MKNLFIGLMVLITVNAFSQDADKDADQFLGSWSVEFFDLPEGEEKATLIFRMVEGKLGGEIKNEQGSTPLYNISIEGKKIKFHYDARGYELFSTMVLIEDDKMEGYLADMFEMIGERIKE